MESYRRALFIDQELAERNPTVTEFRDRMADTHHAIGELQAKTGRPAEAIESMQRSLNIERKLAELNPTVTDFRRGLARTYSDLGDLLSRTARQADALEPLRNGA